ncbi:MAG: class I adenylate-forming enzyme family protein [Pseudobdellovibrio sp.]
MPFLSSTPILLNMNLVEQLCNTKAQLTEADSGLSCNGAELFARVQKRASEFKASGLQNGQRVFIEHGNSIAFFTDLFAVWLNEACAVPIDSTNPEIEIQQLINHCKASFRIKSGDATIEATDFKNVSSHPHANLILYTSGTSGTPKGVVHNFETITQRLNALKNSLPASDFTKTLCVLPTHFGHGLIGNSLFALFLGCELVIAKAFSAMSLQNLAEVVDQYQITFMSSVPSIWRLLESAEIPKLSTLKRIHCASANFSSDLLQKIKRWVSSAKIYNVYGTTETASWVSGYEITSVADAGLVGLGWGMSLSIDAQQNVWIEGEGIALEYWGQPELTAEKLQSSKFNTGDQASLNEQSLQLKGRSDDIINRGGFKIYPSEVESVLLMNDKVFAACVFAAPHSLTENTVVAAVSLKPSQSMSASELETWSRDHLPSYRIPSYWLMSESLPLTSRGKLDKKLILELYLKKQAANE